MPHPAVRLRAAMPAAFLLALVALSGAAPVVAQVEPSSRPPKPDLAPQAVRSDSVDGDEDSAEPTGNVVRGGPLSFFVQPPRGWERIPPRDGEPPGAVFRLRGAAGDEHATVCAVRSIARAVRDSTTLGRFASLELERRRTAAPRMFVVPGDTLLTGDGRWTISRTIRGLPSGRLVSIAFLEEERGFVVLELDASSEAEWKSALPALREMAASYSALGPRGRGGR